MAKYFIEVEKGGRFEIELDEGCSCNSRGFQGFHGKE